MITANNAAQGKQSDLILNLGKLTKQTPKSIVSTEEKPEFLQYLLSIQGIDESEQNNDFVTVPMISGKNGDEEKEGILKNKIAFFESENTDESKEEANEAVLKNHVFSASFFNAIAQKPAELQTVVEFQNLFENPNLAENNLLANRPQNPQNIEFKLKAEELQSFQTSNEDLFAVAEEKLFEQLISKAPANTVQTDKPFVNVADKLDNRSLQIPLKQNFIFEPAAKTEMPASLIENADYVKADEPLSSSKSLQLVQSEVLHNTAAKKPLAEGENLKTFISDMQNDLDPAFKIKMTQKSGENKNAEFNFESNPQKSQDLKLSSSNNTNIFQNRNISFDKIFETQAENADTNISPEITLEELAENINMQNMAGKSSFKMKLNPEGLGEVAIDMFYENGKLSLKISTELIETKKMFNENMEFFKNSLLSETYTDINVDINSYSEKNFSGNNFQNSFNFDGRQNRQKENYNAYTEQNKTFGQDIAETAKMMFFKNKIHLTV